MRKRISKPKNKRKVKRPKKWNIKNLYSFLCVLVIFIFLCTFLIFLQREKSKASLQLIDGGRRGPFRYIKIKNTGKVILTNIEIYIDGKKFKTLRAKLMQNKTLGDAIPLSLGEHVLEAKTPEGAHAVLKVGS